MKITLIAPLILLLTACANMTVSKDSLRQMNFGVEPSEAYANVAVKRYLEKSLLDPDSLRLDCNPIRKGWARDTIYDKPVVGWVKACSVNAKNTYGGYVGAKPYLFVFNGSELTVFDSLDPEDSGRNFGIAD